MTSSDDPPAAASWGVAAQVPACSGGLAVGFAAWLLLASAPEDRLVAAAGLGVTLLATVALLTMRPRLTAGPLGFAVRGPAGTRAYDWRQVAAISAPTRRRRGLAATSLEMDLDDDGLIVLGRTELGADPVDVAEQLRRWWLDRRQRPGG